MRRGRKLFALPSVLLALFALLGCQGTTEEDLQAAKTAEDWAAIGKAKAGLDTKRAELTELHQKIAAAEATDGEESAEVEEGAEAPPSPEQLAVLGESLQQDVFKLADELGGLLVGFINDQGISVGGELTEMQAEAISMKSDLDIDLARSYLDGGEYQRAIDIYTQAQSLDPNNEKLAAAIAKAEELRYMTEERLATVKKNMSQDEVRELLGTPKVHNVREFDGGVIGWFYPKEEPNTAAAVFFREKKGDLKVYKTDFEAVKAPEESES